MVNVIMRNMENIAGVADGTIVDDIATDIIENHGSIFDNKYVKGSIYAAGVAAIGALGYYGYKYIKAGISADKTKSELYKKYDKDIAEANMRASKVYDDLKEAEKEVDRLKTELATVGNTIKKEYDIKMESLNTYIKELEEKLASANKDIEKLTTSFNDANASLEDYKVTNEKLLSENKEMTEKLAKITKEATGDNASEEAIKNLKKK